MKLSAASLAALGVAVLLASLSLVAWRQARALDRLGELAGLEREISLLTSERIELGGRVQFLESRARLVPTARDRLGMRTPSDEAGEMVWLTWTQASEEVER